MISTKPRRRKGTPKELMSLLNKRGRQKGIFDNSGKRRTHKNQNAFLYSSERQRGSQQMMKLRTYM